MPPEMSNKEAIDMMQRSIEEIKMLRRRVEGLTAPAEAYYVIRDIINLLPKQGGGISPDHVWALEKRIKELETNPAETPKDPS